MEKFKRKGSRVMAQRLLYSELSAKDRKLIDRVIRSHDYLRGPTVKRELSELGIEIPLWTLYRRMVQLRDMDAAAPMESGAIVQIIDRKMGTMKIIEVDVAASRVETAVLRLERHAKAGR
ncbi:hypothetical protein E2544_08740 [Achromobacter insolitus]|uniref:hypothetical protein n=1 Tax=Achromobacter insolitus TaxID=217204 RepID=UPI0011EB47D8|nr:hypothetical protein [Achromobacter insolitus]QEK91892.1 hypothetical protein E2544_08740 [Achromobacter insolitus]